MPSFTTFFKFKELLGSFNYFYSFNLSTYNSSYYISFEVNKISFTFLPI